MTKKVIERTPVKDLKEIRRMFRYNFGSKSTVTGEEYKDPNEEGWQKHFQREAEKNKAS